MSTSVRAQVAAFLEPLIPERWDVKPYTVKSIGTLSVPTLFIEHTAIDPLPAAPVGNVQNTVVLTILSNLTDYAQAEDDIDPGVLTLITALDGHDQLGFVRAEKNAVIDTYLGWAVTVTAITEKEA
jgi:hypothetical protein